MQDLILHFFLTIVSLPALLITLLFSLVCRLFRDMVVGPYLRSKYGKAITFLTSTDTTFAMDTSRNRLFTRACYFINGKANISDYQQLFYTKWVNSKLPDEMFKFSCRLCCEFGYFFWIPEKDFKIEDHCYLHDVVPKNENELNLYFKEFLNREIPKDLSPWSMTCINLDENFPGLEPGPHHIFLVNSHHAICDGVSYWRLCSKYLFDQQISDSTIINKNNHSNVSMMTKLKRMARILLFGLGTMVTNLLTFPDKSILHGQMLTGIKLFGCSKSVSLDKIKRIKNITGTKVNDVLISCVSGGLRSLFLKQGVSPKCSRHLIPVAMHSLNEAPKLQNQTAVMIYHDAVEQLTPMERLLKTQENMNKLKNAELAVVYFFVTRAIGNFIPICITGKIVKLLGVTTIFSNLPGPSTPCYIFGQKVVRLFGFIPSIGSIGMAIVAVTYNGQVQFGINADVGVIKTQENLYRLLEDVNQELSELDKHL